LLGVGVVALRGEAERKKKKTEEFVAAVTFGHRGGVGNFKGKGLLLLGWAGLALVVSQA
jgi:hypothetical protein